VVTSSAGGRLALLALLVFLIAFAVTAFDGGSGVQVGTRSAVASSDDPLVETFASPEEAIREAVRRGYPSISSPEMEVVLRFNEDRSLRAIVRASGFCGVYGASAHDKDGGTEWTASDTGLGC
jgi:hypothetical protein